MSTARRLDNITLADIRDVLGQNGKKSQGNWLFQCPICQDSSCDNLIVKGNGAYIHCFSCANNEGGKYVLTEIEKKRAEVREKERKQQLVNEKPIFLNKTRQDKYLEYMEKATKELLKSQEMLNLLYEKRGIDRQTVIDCGIGYDPTEEHWVIPTFSLKYGGVVMGFEYRRKNFDLYPCKEGEKPKKLKREPGFIVDICPVWGCAKAKTLFILEGFLDSMCLRQYLRNKGHEDDYTIYSCSNGVGSLINVMNRITFSNFDEVKLMLDTDEPGCENTNKIIQKYPFVKDVRNFLFKAQCKDFGEWYGNLATQEGR